MTRENTILYKEFFELLREINEERTEPIELTPEEYGRLQQDLKGEAQLGVYVVPNKKGGKHE